MEVSVGWVERSEPHHESCRRFPGFAALDPRCLLRRGLLAAARLPLRLHRDEQGVMSILAVFSVLVFTMLLGMVMNVGRHADVKIRMQNAADAAAYAGGITLAREMNTLAFTNHLLCEVFALAAFYEEAQQGGPSNGGVAHMVFTGTPATATTHAVPPLLDKSASGSSSQWALIAKAFSNAPQSAGAGPIPSPQELARVINGKAQLESALVTGYDDFAYATSQLVLPTLFGILGLDSSLAISGTPKITEFQEGVIQVYPQIAQSAVHDVALRDAVGAGGEGFAALWSGLGQLVERGTDPISTLVADPNSPNGSDYLSRAQNQRQFYAHVYLDDQSRFGWNYLNVGFFGRVRNWINKQPFHYARLSQYYNIFRTFDCGYLEQLLKKCPSTNLPMMFRDLDLNQVVNNQQALNSYIDSNLNYVAVVYWKQMAEMMPQWLRSHYDGASSQSSTAALYRNPTASDAVAYAQVQVFVPQRRITWFQWPNPPGSIPGGGGSGNIVPMPGSGQSGSGTKAQVVYYVNLQGDNLWSYTTDSRCPMGWSPSSNPPQTFPIVSPWSLWNQNWTAQLVPTSVGVTSGQQGLAKILQTPPSIQGESTNPPNLGGTTSSELSRINANLLRISPH